MKKEIFIFLLGGLTFLCVGAGVATSTDIFTVRPALPKYSKILSATSEQEINNKATSYLKEGYLISKIVAHPRGVTVVMEKY